MTILDKDFYTPDEVAIMLRFETSHVRKQCREGNIKATKPFGGEWRISKQEVKKLLKSEK